jgi:hypothetical protein
MLMTRSVLRVGAGSYRILQAIRIYFGAKKIARGSKDPILDFPKANVKRGTPALMFFLLLADRLRKQKRANRKEN